jgi:hypothetical protein
MQRQLRNEPSETDATEALAPQLDRAASLQAAGDLRSVERLLAALERPQADPFTLPRRPPPREPEAPPPSSALQSWAMQPLPTAPSEERHEGMLAWLFLTLGLMAFACGSAMLIWSIVESREELWTLGIPMVLGGQAAIIFGLIGLVESANQRHKQAAAALEEHRQRLVMMQNLAVANPPHYSNRRAA